MGDKIFNWLSLFLYLAMLAVVFQSPNTAGIFRAFGEFFSGAIDAAQRV